MTKIKLSEICDLQNGYAFKSTDYVEVSNTLSCRMSNIRLGGIFDIEYNSRYLPDSFSEKFKNFLLKDGDLVIAMTDLANDPKLLGVPTLVKTGGKNILLNQRVGKLIIKDSSAVDNRYLQYVLNDPKTRKYYKKFASGGLQINLGKNDLLNVEIFLPPLEEQRRIASILDKADDIRQKRQQAIAKLDELLQATFIDMFGDPVSNPKCWKTAKLSELVSKDITYGVLKPEEYTQDGIPMLRIQDINSVDLSKVDNFHLISEKLSQQYKRTILEGNEIVISLVGTIGLVAKVPLSFKGFNVHRNLGVISLKDHSKVDFLESLMKLPHFKVLLERCTKGGVHKLLNLSDLRDLPVYLPDSKLIADYTKILIKIKKLKIDAYSGSEHQDTLFQSLQQKAFNGTL